MKQFSSSFFENGAPINEQEDENSLMNISTAAQLHQNNLSTMIEHYSTNSANSSLLQGYRPSFGVVVNHSGGDATRNSQGEIMSNTEVGNQNGRHSNNIHSTASLMK